MNEKNTVSKVLTLSLPRPRVIDMSIVLTKPSFDAFQYTFSNIYLTNVGTWPWLKFSLSNLNFSKTRT